MYLPGVKFDWHNDNPIDKGSEVLVVRIGGSKVLNFRRGMDKKFSFQINHGDVYKMTQQLNGRLLIFLSDLSRGNPT
jgi:hypothetical protein